MLENKNMSNINLLVPKSSNNLFFSFFSFWSNITIVFPKIENMYLATATNKNRANRTNHDTRVTKHEIQTLISHF